MCYDLIEIQIINRRIRSSCGDVLVYHVGLIMAFVFSFYVSRYIGLLFRAITAIGAEEAWWLPTFVLHMRGEIVFPIENAVAIRIRANKLGRWILLIEALLTEVYEICKKTLGTHQSSARNRGGHLSISLSLSYITLEQNG